MSLMPPNATPFEKAMAQALDARFATIPVEINTLWDPARCPEPLLAWLAWALSVDTWDASWPEGTRRSVIASSVSVHRKKGTAASVHQLLDAMGYADAVVHEQWGDNRYDATLDYDGLQFYQGTDQWADYRVTIPRPITISQADQIRAALAKVAPARCRLVEILFTEAPHLYDGTTAYDGTFPYGAS